MKISLQALNTEKPLPFRGGVGVGTVRGNRALAVGDSPHPNPSPEGEGFKDEGVTPLRRSTENGFTPLRRSAENGFTLVELMVVIVIIGLLATLVAITVIPQLGKANDQKAKADIATLDQALELYRLNNLSYPVTAEGLGALITAPPSIADPSRYQVGGYIKKLPKDPWGRDYKYENPGKRGAYDIYTLGADGAEGGTGENADIGNWQ